MFCPRCGTNLPDNASFCTSCGAPLGGAAQQSNPYQQNPYQPNPGYGQYRANIQNRNVVTCILLTIVTCGLYGLYWFFCLVNDLNTASGDVDDPSGVTVFLLSLVTCGIYSWVWLYKAGEKVDKIRTRHGEAASNSGILYIILCLLGLGFVDYCLIQSELNKVAAL